VERKYVQAYTMLGLVLKFLSSVIIWTGTPRFSLFRFNGYFSRWTWVSRFYWS